MVTGLVVALVAVVFVLVLVIRPAGLLGRVAKVKV